MMIKRATLCSKSCMIYLAKTLFFLLVCKRHIQVSIEFMFNVERLFEFWISCRRSFQSRNTDGKKDFYYN